MIRLYRNDILVGEGKTKHECFSAAWASGIKISPFAIEAFVSKNSGVYKSWRLENDTEAPVQIKKARKVSVLSSPLPSGDEIEDVIEDGEAEELDIEEEDDDD
jgi:hypothetical protein